MIPTYQDMYNKVTALNTAVQKLSTSSSDNDVANAADAWVAARKPWEKSEAFLYGPADLNKLYPTESTHGRLSIKRRDLFQRQKGVI
mgnify:CR=1 FL=1